MIKTIASFLGGVPLAVVLFFVPGVGLAEWWEHNPNAPAIAQGHLLFWSWDFRPLAVQAAAERADYMTERQAFWTVDNALKGQNAAVLNVKRAADRWQAASLVAEADAVRSNAWRLALAKRIAAQPGPVDQSELGLCRAADAVLLEVGP